ncbi:MAG: trehalose-phosphatase [Dehalococcoidia bacterium]
MAQVALSREQFDAVVLDLDGVITDTASVHAAAWKQLFDRFLSERAERAGEPFRPFDVEHDYLRHVDGKSRSDGVVSFLDSRAIALPYGDPSDPEDRETVCGLGKRKDRYFHERLAAQGVVVFASTIALVEALRRAGFGVAVISASRNCRAILEASGLSGLFDARVDGEVAAERGLPGKPDPAIFLEAARRLASQPARTVVIEDAEAGVEAGARGGFALVIGVDRVGGAHARALRERGAHVVVDDLGAVRVGDSRERPVADIPDALGEWERLAGRLRTAALALFLDFDGTLSPIVEDPELAELLPGTRAVLERLGRRCTVAVISGRDLQDVRRRVGITGIWYAGSHGFELMAPDGTYHEQDAADDAVPALDRAERSLSRRLSAIEGVLLERKRFTLAVHYRRVDRGTVGTVTAAVDEACRRERGLRVMHGKQVMELRPDVDWDKGSALHRLVDQLHLDRRRVLPLYGGDDLTDEDAFRALAGWGIGVLVRDAESAERSTVADVAVDGPEAFRALLDRIALLIEDDGE